jgi:hypothetical protein
MAEVGGLDFEMVAPKLLLLALGDRILRDAELNLDPGDGDIRIAKDALGWHFYSLLSNLFHVCCLARVRIQYALQHPKYSLTLCTRSMTIRAGYALL